MPNRSKNLTLAALAAISVVFLMASSGGLVGLNPLGNSSATPTTSSARVLSGPAVTPNVPGTNVTVALNGTNITNSAGVVIGALNNTTARPWGEVYDSINGCTYVTEDPATNPAGQGYLTTLGPVQPTPTSLIIPGGLNPQGIAWAKTFYNETGPLRTLFQGGILAIADTGSNSVSFFGVFGYGSSGTVSCQAQYIQTDAYLPDYSTYGLLSTPWDVVYVAHSSMFYVTWETSNVVSAFDGPTIGCEFENSLTDPVGLSSDSSGRLEVANFQANGWVTELKTTSVTDATPAACAGNVPAAVSKKILDRPIWTAYAPLMFYNNSTAGVKSSVAVSDSNYGINGNLVGTGTPVGCAGVHLGVPKNDIMAELVDGTLKCTNSVTLEPTALPTNPGTFGIAYNSLTDHVLEVLNTQGIVEGVDYTHAFYSGDHAAPASTPAQSIEVIWFSSTSAFYHGTAASGSMIVTNWGAGTLYIATGL
jgi:hypothetical protein